MIAFDKTKINSQISNVAGTEQRFQARAVSRGVAIGRIVCLYGEKQQFYQILLQDGQIESELQRLRAAVSFAKQHLKKLSSEKHISETQTGIFETHQLILDDKALVEKIEAVIKEQKVNAEWAVKLVADRYISIYKDIQDEHLRERHIDLQDVTERILASLGGENKAISLEKNSIIVAKEIKPSTLAELSQSDLKAIIAENGGWTSHTFILARELNLPAVTGAKGILRRVQTGDKVIVDGFSGQLVLNPTNETLERYKTSAIQFQEVKTEKKELEIGETKTLDGKKITIRANLDIPKGYDLAKRFGAEGIGLFRSEFLFKRTQNLPSEQEQTEAYRQGADLAGAGGVKVRTFDFGAEQLTAETEDREKNPALGLRAIRLGLSNEGLLRTQLRALLQASFEKNLDIVLPMISDVSEILRVKEILKEEKARLEKQNIKFGNPNLGAMIEVPSAVMMIEEIAAEVDFLSLGTNDLVQYLLAVDRDNESVADWFRTLHPAVLRVIKKVIDAAEKCEKPLIICGEMAGSPVYASVLIGLGATDLSMNVNSIPRVKHVISNIAFEEARGIVKNLEACTTSDEAEEIVRLGLSSRWAHLFSANIFPTKKNLSNQKTL